MHLFYFFERDTQSFKWNNIVKIGFYSFAEESLIINGWCF